MIADKISRLEHIRIRGKFDYSQIHALSTEARQKLERIDPRNHSAGFAHTGYFAERYKHIVAIGGTLMFHVKQIARKPLNKGIERIKQ